MFHMPGLSRDPLTRKMSRAHGCIALLSYLFVGSLLSASEAGRNIAPEAYGFKTLTVTIPSTGGSGGTTALSYVDAGPRGAGPDRTILGLHGYTDSWNTYRLIMKQLPQYRFISLSLPCFGDSSKDPSYDSYQKQAAAVVAFLDQLGIAKANVIGHSMSSVLAQVRMQSIINQLRMLLHLFQRSGLPGVDIAPSPSSPRTTNSIMFSLGFNGLNCCD